MNKIPPQNTQKNITFIDLFAGIGGFHLALHSLGCECVFASEIDAFARKTYIENFSNQAPQLFQNNRFNEDIRQISPYDLPNFDILCAGFPCQPFSQAGQKRGFNDAVKSERGNLFFIIAEIIKIKRPQAYFLENVQGLLKHDNGRTFQVIKDILTNELGYSLHYKIVKACDYGLPQLRPRLFMIGFKDEKILSNFTFPHSKPLKFTMSDVWQASCSREIGFTLRVGGRGSKIHDRRNWDAYLVDGAVRQLTSHQAQKMQGFPDEFHLPTSETQAMKLLGNSVAVDAVRECAKSLLDHLHTLKASEDLMPKSKNKGEWTELYALLKIILDKKLYLANKDLNIQSVSDFITVTKVTTLNIEEECLLYTDDKVRIQNKTNNQVKELEVSSFLNKETISRLYSAIRNGAGTFTIPEFEYIESQLGLTLKKGGNSNQKSDIILDFEKEGLLKKSDEGFGIKSYIGSKPTLLNASGNTNFIFEVIGLNPTHIESINSISTRTKLIDRINKITELGGQFVFKKVEKETMEYNLIMVDSNMPQILAAMLLEFFVYRNSSLNLNLASISKKKLFQEDLQSLTVKIKRLLLAILLGFFAGSRWDGKYVSNGIIVVKEDGEQVAYHIIDLHSLEDYLFEHIKFDSPSTTRHCYGSAILEKDGKIYFKFNMQLRF